MMIIACCWFLHIRTTPLLRRIESCDRRPTRVLIAISTQNWKSCYCWFFFFFCRMEPVPMTILHSFVGNLQNRCDGFTEGRIQTEADKGAIGFQWGVVNRFRCIGSKGFRSSDVLSMQGRVLVLATPSSHGHVPHCAPSRPVSLALLTEMAWLVDVVVVVVTELGVHAVAAGARQYLDRLLFHCLLFGRLGLLLFGLCGFGGCPFLFNGWHLQLNLLIHP